MATTFSSCSRAIINIVSLATVSAVPHSASSSARSAATARSTASFSATPPPLDPLLSGHIAYFGPTQRVGARRSM